MKQAEGAAGLEIPRDPPDATSIDPEDGLHGRRRWLAAGTIWLGLMAVSTEMFGMNVALPAIASEFHVSAAGATWVIKAYQLGVLLTLLPLSALGERIGYKRINQLGLLVYSVAASICLFSPSFPALVVARLVQGIGMAGIVSVNGALVRHIFPKSKLVRAFSYNSLIVATCGAAGPPITSMLIAVASWRLLFVIGAPICLVALILGSRSLPDNPRSERYETGNAMLYMIVIALLFLGAEGLRLDYGETTIAAAFATATLFGLILVRRSLASPRPLLPVDLLRFPLFLMSVITSISSFAAQTIAFIAIPFILIRDMGRPAIEVGPILMCWPIAVAAAAPLAGRLSDRLSTGTLAGIGLLFMTTGLAVFAMLPAGAGTFNIIWPLSLCGFGFGFFQGPNNHLLLTSAPIARAGAAAGMQSIARHLGQVAGASAAAVVFTLAPQHESIAIALAAAIAGAGAALSLSRKMVA